MSYMCLISIVRLSESEFYGREVARASRHGHSVLLVCPSVCWENEIQEKKGKLNLWNKRGNHMYNYHVEVEINDKCFDPVDRDSILKRMLKL